MSEQSNGNGRAVGPEQPGLVESTLDREILQSEWKRVTLLIALLGFVLILILAVRMLIEFSAPELRARLLAALGPFSLIGGSYLIYECLIRVWLGRLLAGGRVLPRGFRYCNVLLETSLPTAALLTGGIVMDPLSVLAGAVPFLYFLFILLAALNLDFWLCVFAGGVSCLQFLAVSLFLVERGAVSLEITMPVVAMVVSPHQYVAKAILLLAGGLIAGFVARQIRRQLSRVIETLNERDRAVSIFGQHVSPQVADLLLKQPLDYAGQERNVCVMFLDIRDFSKLSSERTASEVVDFLNVLFAPMIPVINSHSGIVNKFLGDGFMAVFGAPLDDRQQCSHAIQASLEMLRQVEILNAQGKIPHTRLGIGLHVGKAVTGNVGSSQRKEYTIIGDVVNLASRIEQANKALSSQLLVSEAVANTAGVMEEFSPEDMGLVELKGQRQPVRLYKLV
jgi:adenylate cyclase